MTVIWYGIQGPITKQEHDYQQWERETLSYAPDFIPEDEDDFMSYSSADVV